MKLYPCIFGTIACLLVYRAGQEGGWGWLLLWPAVSFAVVTAGYLGLGPRIFGKRPDGSLSPASVVVLLPFLLMDWGLWHVVRCLRQSPACHLVGPKLWLGRRPLDGELPERVNLIVDLTAEFTERRSVIGSREYLCLPTLDTRAPDEGAVRQVIEKCRGEQYEIYVHCASGHGRSSLLVAVILLDRGLVHSLREAEVHLKGIRPGVTWSSCQRAFLEKHVASLSTRECTAAGKD